MAGVWEALPDEGLPPAPALGIGISPRGAVWVVTDRGLAWMDGGRWRHTLSPVAQADLVRGFFGSPRGAVSVAAGPTGVWIGGGEWFFDGRQWWPWDVRGGDRRWPTGHLTLDRRGVPYAGTDEGLVRFDGRRWVSVPGSPRESVYGLVPDTEGTLWVSSGWDADTLSRYDGRRWTTIVEEGNLRAFACRAVDAQGSVWGVTRHGVARIRRSGHIDFFEGARDGLPEDVEMARTSRIHDLAATTDGAVWAATDAGVCVFRGRRWERAVDAPRAPISAITVGPDGRVWAASDLGVVCHDGTGWSVAGVEDGYPSAHVYRLASDPSGGLWAGSTAGLSRFDGRRWMTRRNDELFTHYDDLVTALGSDGRGNGVAWLSAGQLVVRVPPVENGAIRTCLAYAGTQWPAGLPAPEAPTTWGLSVDEKGAAWAVVDDRLLHHTVGPFADTPWKVVGGEDLRLVNATGLTVLGPARLAVSTAQGVLLIDADSVDSPVTTFLGGADACDVAAGVGERLWICSPHSLAVAAPSTGSPPDPVLDHPDELAAVTEGVDGALYVAAAGGCFRRD